GFKVEATVAGSALDRFRQLAPDLVVVEVRQSDPDGLRLCRVLRDGSEVPLIVLNGRQGEDLKLAAFEAGADDHLEVPFHDRELAARARALMRRARWNPDRADPISVGGIEVCLNEREVRTADQRLHLR